MIADWRDEVGAEKFLKQKQENSDAFHEMWPESVYGQDKYGHYVLGMQVGEINTDGLCAMDQYVPATAHLRIDVHVVGKKGDSVGG